MTGVDIDYKYRGKGLTRRTRGVLVRADYVTEVFILARRRRTSGSAVHGLKGDQCGFGTSHNLARGRATIGE